jgi:hypothetical protein
MEPLIQFACALAKLSESTNKPDSNQFSEELSTLPSIISNKFPSLELLQKLTELNNEQKMALIDAVTSELNQQIHDKKSIEIVSRLVSKLILSPITMLREAILDITLFLLGLLSVIPVGILNAMYALENNNIQIENPAPDYWFHRKDNKGCSHQFLNQGIYLVNTIPISNSKSYFNCEIYNNPTVTQNPQNIIINTFPHDPFTLEQNNYISDFLSNNPYSPSNGVSFSARIKAENLQGGSRGWGFWNTCLLGNDNYAWFIQLEGYDNDGNPYPWTGFWAQTRNSNGAAWPPSSCIKLADLDEEWHDYRIEMTGDKVEYFMDGQSVAIVTDKNSIPNTPMAFHNWVDNALYVDGAPIFQNTAAPRCNITETMSIRSGVMQNITDFTGASYPPKNGVNSSYVPRVSLPGIMGIQTDFSQEWWYYVGTVNTKEGKTLSLMMTILRGGDQEFQIGAGILGIGWKENEVSHSFRCNSIGIGASQTTAPPSPLNSLSISSISDSNYELQFKPLLEIVNSGNDPFFINDSNQWNIKYTGGNILASVGSTYDLAAEGKGYIAISNSATTSEASYQLSLSVIDRKGMVMENKSGVVGNTYECAQPFLEIMPGGKITIDGETHFIENGWLWMDRQMVSKSNATKGGAIGSGNDLKNWVSANPNSLVKPFYTGNWISVNLNKGLSLALTAFWDQHPNQWISGTVIAEEKNNKHYGPQKGAFGNIYYNEEYASKMGNGGRFLRPRLYLSQPNSEWDYDINILDPSNMGSHSPHWISPQSGVTYATAWHIQFSPDLKIDDLPQDLFLFSVCENSEIFIDKQICCFEGAALVYDSLKPKSKIIGHAFTEQMGYN